MTRAPIRTIPDTMSDTRLLLLTPLLGEVEPFAARLGEALAGGDVAAVLVRLEAADERTLVKRVKGLVPLAERGSAALVLAVPGMASSGILDLATVAIRGGADGIHTEDLAMLERLRETLTQERILGVGNVRARHDAMTAGEAGVDYLMFGEPRPDGYVPDREATLERAAWWADIFEPPCAAYASALTEVAETARTGVDFVALGDAVWAHPDGPAAAIRVALAATRMTEPVA